jgi:chromosome segregation ATPase
LHDAQANLKKAEEARDKFSEANKEASRIIGSKGSELGILKQELTEAREAVADLEKQLEGKGVSPTPSTTPTPEKPIEDELAEVEKSLSEEQVQMADALLQAEQDDNRAYALVNDPKERLAFLKELKSDPANRSRPVSFFAKQEDTGSNVSTPGGAETAYERLKKQIKGVPMGPSGHSVRSTGGQPVRTRPRGTLV